MKKIVLLILLIAACDYREASINKAQTWASENYPGERFHADCMSRDTDSDGYVSCSLVHQPAERGGQRMQPIGLQCSTGSGVSCGNDGCKISVAR